MQKYCLATEEKYCSEKELQIFLLQCQKIFSMQFFFEYESTNGPVLQIFAEPIHSLLLCNTSIDEQRDFQTSFTCYSESDQPFLGALFGHYSYEYSKKTVPNSTVAADEKPARLICFRYQFIYQPHKHSLTLSAKGHCLQQAQDFLCLARRKLSLINTKKLIPLQLQALQANLTDAQFCEQIRLVQEAIRDGEALQVVLSRCFHANYKGDPLHFFMELRTSAQNNSVQQPYRFYLQEGGYCLVGASPETQLRHHSGQLCLKPLAGTRRVVKEEQRQRQQIALQQDSKELAEHTMLVDLARNDLSKVAALGSVDVPRFAEAVDFGYLLHLSSTVSAQLDDNSCALAALAASFPAGTLIGAPKSRASQIITELEQRARGYYGGCFFLLSAEDALESCIAIRFAEFQQGRLCVQSGAGIVIDSIPLAEANETWQKAYSVFACQQTAVTA